MSRKNVGWALYHTALSAKELDEDRGDSALFARSVARRKWGQTPISVSEKMGENGDRHQFPFPEIGVCPLYEHIALADEPLQTQQERENDEEWERKF